MLLEYRALVKCDLLLHIKYYNKCAVLLQDIDGE